MRKLVLILAAAALAVTAPSLAHAKKHKPKPAPAAMNPLDPIGQFVVGVTNVMFTPVKAVTTPAKPAKKVRHARKKKK